MKPFLRGLIAVLTLGAVISGTIFPLFAQKTVTISQPVQEVALNSYVEILADPAGKLDAGSIRAQPGFMPVDSAYALKAEQVYWGRFVLQNHLQEAGRWVFYADWNAQPEHNGLVKVYVFDADSVVEKQTGRYLPASQKDLRRGPGNPISISLQAGQQLAVYFRVEKINHAPPIINARLLSFPYWQSLNQQKRNVREGMVQGMLWMMILYSFVIFLGTRDQTYLVYTLFLLASSVYFLALSGILGELLFQEMPKVNAYIRIIVSNTLAWAFFQFTRTFVDTQQLIPKWDRVGLWVIRGIIVLMGVELLICALWFHEPVLNTLINLAFLAEGLFLLVVIVRFWFTPHPLARIFILGTSCMVLAAFLGVGMDLMGELTSYLTLLETAFIAQVLTFALGLAYRLRRGEREKLEAQQILNERLVQADKLKDAFLANTSHELRTPLYGILGLSEALYEGIENLPADEIRMDLQMVMVSARRLTNMVNDLLDFSRLKTRELIIDCKAVDVHALAEVVLYTNRPLLRGKPVQLLNRIPEEVPLLWADEDRVQQILFNLLGNAIKFTEQGRIEVGITEEAPPPLSGSQQGEEQAGRFLTIYVSDTGIGIPEDKQAIIFEEFEQADSSTRRQYGGSGLGLSISKRLVELHEGSLWLRSRVGEGSTFFFRLPLAPEGAEQPAGLPLTPLKQIAPPGRELAVAPAKSGDIRILLVDDEVINHQVLKNYLSHTPYQLVSAMNGEEALRLIRESPSFALVLLDIMMPRMLGYEVCEQIRKDFLPNELPIIMVTAKNQVADLVEALSYGANDYLSKPFSKAEFLARLETQLNLHHIHAITRRFVPLEFIRSLNFTHLTEVKRGDHVSREVTVMFSDIRAYTALAESMSPDENFGFVNAYSGRMGPIIREHHGFVHQYLGDGIMAIFLEQAAHALQAAVHMQKAIQTYNVQRQQRGRQPLKVGIGLHTGELIMGIIGDEERTDAATIADSVNVASRVEGLTKFFGASILLSESAMQQIKAAGRYEDFHFRYLGKVRMVGKADALGIYECIEGDSPQQFQLKQQGLTTFRRGLAHYYARDFVNALADFKRITSENAHDKAALHFLSRASQYVVQGVASDWVGIESMDQK